MDRTNQNGWEKLYTSALFKPGHTIAAPLLDKTKYPWEVLPEIQKYIKEAGAALNLDDYHSPRPGVWIHKTAVVAPSAFIGDDVIIGAGTEVRHCAFIRGCALIGEGVVVGNSTELKNVILFDCVQVPHYNYVGDSVLGYKSHMGAGSITSNVKSDKTLVSIALNGEKHSTGLKKFGAILGDHVEIGCGSVMNPGSVIGRETCVYPLSMVRGFVPGGSIYKKQGEVISKREEP